MKAPLFVACTVSLSLTCCVGARPAPPAQATITVPEIWRGTSTTTDAGIATQWWAGFGSASLNTLVARALANNMDIAIAASRVEEARAQLHAARAEGLPQLGAGLGGGPQRALNAFGIGTDQTAVQGQFTASYDLDLFGRLSASTASARAALLASRASADTVRLSVAATTVSGYINLLTLDARLKVLHDTAAAREESLRITRRRSQTGYSPMLDWQQAQAELQAALALIPPTEMAIRRQENALSALAGDPPHNIERDSELGALQLSETPIGLPARILRQRPDIFQAEQTLVAADHSLDAARSQFLPDISLRASGGFIGSTLLSDPVSIFSLGGSILAPLFEGGRLRAGTEAAAARRDQAAFSYRRSTLTAFREVEDALAGIKSARQQVSEIEIQRDALAASLSMATARYRAGYSPYLEQLDAERALLSCELQLIEVRSDMLSARVSLIQAIGGGWSPSQLPND